MPTQCHVALCRQHEATGDASPPAAYQHDVDHRQSSQQDISLHLPQGGAVFAAVQSSNKVRPQSSSALCLSLPGASFTQCPFATMARYSSCLSGRHLLESAGSRLANSGPHCFRSGICRALRKRGPIQQRTGQGRLSCLPLWYSWDWSGLGVELPSGGGISSSRCALVNSLVAL